MWADQRPGSYLILFLFPLCFALFDAISCLHIVGLSWDMRMNTCKKVSHFHHGMIGRIWGGTENDAAKMALKIWTCKHSKACASTAHSHQWVSSLSKSWWFLIPKKLPAALPLACFRQPCRRPCPNLCWPCPGPVAPRWEKGQQLLGTCHAVSMGSFIYWVEHTVAEANLALTIISVYRTRIIKSVQATMPGIKRRRRQGKTNMEFLQW